MKRLWDVLEVVAILASWCAVLGLVNPRGNFPLHDDWDFAVATWNFARTGHFHFTQFTAVSLRAQVLWGALWTRAFAQSFEVLRASTLTLSAATLLLINVILRAAPLTRFARVVACLALLVHPIFLWASCTYMTDIPYLFASALAFYFFLRGLRHDRLLFIILGCAAAVVSWFVRQNGVINLIPPLILILVQRRRMRLLLPIAVTCVLFAAIFMWHRDWLAGSPEMFARHYHMLTESSFRLPEQIAVVDHYVMFNALNCAAFFLPLTLPLIALRSSNRAAIVVAVISIPVFWRVVDLGMAGYWMPYASPFQYSDILPGPIVFDWGIGPPNLSDVFSMHFDYPFRLQTFVRVILTFGAAVLATLLIWALIRYSARTLVSTLAVASVVVGTAALCLSGYYYDRYALDSAWALVVAAPFVVPWERRAARIAAIVGLIAAGIFSTCAVQEYFAWNRARWGLYNDLRARGVAIEQIDGGVEAWAFYELANADRSKAARGHPPRPYLIAFHVVPGYRVIEARPFAGFFGLRRGAVYALHRGSGL